MGIGSARSPSGVDADSEPTDLEEGAADDSIQNTRDLSGILSGC